MATSNDGGDPGGKVEMDREVAQRLFEVGAAVVLLDVPVGTEVGIDMNSWNVGNKFKGIKMIPPGLKPLTQFYSVDSSQSRIGV